MAIVQGPRVVSGGATGDCPGGSAGGAGASGAASAASVARGGSVRRGASVGAEAAAPVYSGARGGLPGPRVVSGSGLERFEEADGSDVDRAMAFAATLRDEGVVVASGSRAGGGEKRGGGGGAAGQAARPAVGQVATGGGKVKVAGTPFEQMCSRVTSLSNLHEIYVLDLTSKGLESVGDMGNLVNLRMLNLGHNKLRESFGEKMPAASVQELRLHNNRLKDCGGLSKLGKRMLRVLCLSHNEVESFGEELKGLRSLEVLKADSNRLSVLDGGVLPPSLVHIDVGRNRIAKLVGMDRLANLEELNLSGNGLSALPPGLERMSKLSDLHLGDNTLDCKVGLAPLKLLRKSLGSLHLQRNPLVGPTLAQLPRLSALTELTVSECDIVSLFPVTSACPSLEYLDASRNKIPSAGQAARDLAGLKDVLEEIRLEGNPLCDDGGAYRGILEISLGPNLATIDGVPTASAVAADNASSAAAAAGGGSPLASPRAAGERQGTPLMHQPRPGTASGARPGTASGPRTGTASGHRGSGDGGTPASAAPHSGQGSSSRRMIAEWNAVEAKVHGSREDWRLKFGEMRSALRNGDPRSKPDNDIGLRKGLLRGDTANPNAVATVAALGREGGEDERPSLDPLVTMSLVDITARPSRRRLTGAREFAGRFSTDVPAAGVGHTPSAAPADGDANVRDDVVFTDSGAGVGLATDDGSALDVASLMHPGKASFVRSAHHAGPPRPGSARPLSARPLSSAGGGARVPLVSTWGAGRDPNVVGSPAGDPAGNVVSKQGPKSAASAVAAPGTAKKGGFRGFKTSTGKQVRLHNAA